MPKNWTPALPAEVPRLYEGYMIPRSTHRHTNTRRSNSVREKGERESPHSHITRERNYTYAESEYHRRFERAPKHQRATDHDGAPCSRACGGAVVQALAPAEERKEAEELWLYDQRHVQVLRDHVDAQWERRDAPEESA
jgi:hypothetical protein